METFFSVPEGIRGTWTGRISGCLAGKPVEFPSFREGRDGLEFCLRRAGTLPLREAALGNAVSAGRDAGRNGATIGVSGTLQ